MVNKSKKRVDTDLREVFRVRHIRMDKALSSLVKMPMVDVGMESML
jgi:hypothetical protein